MLPGIDLRLQNVLKALREVVLPAIPPDQRLARDQAMLAIGHIAIVADQWREAARYEAGSLSRLIALAEHLTADATIEVEGDVQRRLEEALIRATAADPSDLRQAEGLIQELGTLIDAVILGAGRPGTLPPTLLDAVLSYGEAQAHRERVWFAGTKLDPDVAELETIADMLAADR